MMISAIAERRNRAIVFKLPEEALEMRTDWERFMRSIFENEYGCHDDTIDVEWHTEVDAE